MNDVSFNILTQSYYNILKNKVKIKFLFPQNKEMSHANKMDTYMCLGPALIRRSRFTSRMIIFKSLDVHL
jgi:hypothetical protein